MDSTDPRLLPELHLPGDASFRTLADVAPVKIWVTNPEGYCTYLNQRWRDFTGQTLEQGLGDGWLDCVHPDDAPAMGDAFLRANERREPFRLEYRLRRHDGAYRWMVDSGAPWFAEDGRFLGFIGSVIDISENKRTETALREAFELAERRAAELDAVIESLPNAVFIGTEAGIARCNAAALNLLGVSSVTDLRQGIADLVTDLKVRKPDGSPVSLEQLSFLRALSGETGSSDLILNYQATGEERQIRSSSAPVILSGRVIGAISVHTDLTDWKQSEAALRTSEESFRRLAEASPQFVWSSGPDGKLNYINSRWCEYTGLTREQSLAGEHFQGALHPDDVPEVQRVWEEAFTAGQPYESQFRLRGAADGVYRWFLVRAAPIRDAQGRILQWLGTTTNVDSYKRAEEERRQLLDSERAARDEAERVSRIKDEFVATLSHELRTPLNAILGWSQLLRDKLDDPKIVEQGLQVIERNARSQAKMISDLLDMGRIISGKIRLDVQAVDLAAVIDNAAEAVRLAAEAKGIRLEKAIESGITLAGDPGRLQQVAWNLLSNAIKFTPAEGRVRIELARRDGFAEIRVSDTGTGIKPEFLPQVFQRFRQGDASTTRALGGLGLGLSIVKQLAELHGGTVHAESAGEGQGSVFWIQLPLGRTPGLEEEVLTERPETHPPHDLTPRSLRGLRVLVVDDQEDNRELVRRLLEESEAEVTAASSAAEALAAIQRARPDVLVSDLGMPGEDGYDLVRRIRALPPEQGGRMPALALSALARPEDRERALRSGFQAHLAKPVEPPALVAAIAALAGRAT